ncbi:MAG: DUF4147 domain-containing protein [Candidatus Pacebacteria bacterium]|nr:DUF4147 domain-containing protein [Candidatus Paceibacterota bacterium]
MLIKNYSLVSDTKQKRDLLKAVDHAVSYSMPKNIINNILKKTGNSIFVNNKKAADFKKNRIFVIGAGKASGKMAEVFEKIVGAKNITAGSINYKGRKPKTKKIKAVLAGHPLPNEASIRGTEKILNLKKKYEIGKEDVIFCLVSGGGSALLEKPADGIILSDMQKTTKELLYCGASINEINAIRQELSKVKGGKLARYFYPAKIYSLIISDVIGNDLKTIASGPTVNIRNKDSAFLLIKKYNLENKIPNLVFKKIQDPYVIYKKFPKVENIIISDVNDMIDVAKEKFEAFGYKTTILNRRVTGETKDQAKKYAKKIVSLSKKNELSKFQKTAYIFGGETTVTINNKKGKGGRNQEFAAVFLNEMKEFDGKWAFISCASDGTDFLDGVAGGIVDYKTFEIIKNKKIDINKYLETHNSYNFLKKVNGLIFMGNGTGTNVCDIQVCVVWK